MNTAHPSQNIAQLRDFLQDHLLGNVVPFWIHHAVDPAGGLNTCIRDDGSLVSRDKWLWSQWRAVWVFSKLYNCMGHNKEWLDLAKQIYRFTARYGWDDRIGGWVLRLSGDGQVQTGCESIYVDGFAIYGLTELARATGAEEYAQLARKTADSVLRRLQQPHDRIPHFPYPIPAGHRVHGIPMMFSLVFWELGQLLNEPRYRQAALAMSDDIFSHFYRPDRDMLLERIAADNSEGPPPLGTAVVPGHVIEDMWFQIHIAQEAGMPERIQQAVRLIKRHCELGWDADYGGLALAVDADGRTDVGWAFADTKLWWPHTEMMYALLLAYANCRAPWCLEWYDRVHAYAFAHYPARAHGEWMQKLDRQGRPITKVVALPVKDPFHLPRALIYCVEILNRLADKHNEAC